MGYAKIETPEGVVFKTNLNTVRDYNRVIKFLTDELEARKSILKRKQSESKQTNVKGD